MVPTTLTPSRARYHGSPARNSRRSTAPPRGTLYPISAGRPPESSSRARWTAILVAAAALLAVGAWGLIKIQHPCCPNGFGVVVVEVNGPDAESAGNGLALAGPLIDAKAAALAAAGGGTVHFLRTDGNKAELTTSVDLEVLAPDGSKETDAATRDEVVADRMATAIAAAQAAAGTTPGRALLPVQVMAAQLAPPRGLPFDVVYVGFGLGDQDPLDQRRQVAGMDPSQSVDSVEDKLAQTPGAVYTLVFTAAAGRQPDLNTTTRQWRTAWWERMAAATGATIDKIQDQNTPADPPAGAPTAGVIPNIPEITVPGTTTPPSTPATTPAVTRYPKPSPAAKPTPTPTKPVPVNPAPVVLVGALFEPDSPDWVDQQQARQQLQPLADAWKHHPGAYQPLTCIGRTARYGEKSGALDLSVNRSAQALSLARQMGIDSVAEPDGRGYDDPLPNYPPTDPAQRSVTCQLTPKK